MSSKSLTYIQLNGKSSATESPWVERTYRMWSQVWREALVELEGSDRLSSDDFTRHDYLGVLGAGEEPIGSVSFSTVDMTQERWRADSYFAAWPPEQLVKVGARFPGPQVMIGCYFTLTPQYRRASAGFSAKQLLMALVVEELRHSTCGAMVGTMRANRGMHKLAYDSGAGLLASGLVQHGVEVDLVLWERASILEMAARPFESEAARLFKNKIDLINQPVRTLRRVA